MKNLILLFTFLVLSISCKKHNDIPEPIPSDNTSFLSFAIQDQISANTNISNHQISVIIPFGVKIDSLIAVFTLPAGSSVVVDSIVQQSNITINDFTNPKTYTITAENGTSKMDWIVSVDYESYSYISTDFPVGGTTYLMNSDTMGFSSYSVGSAGKGKIWSFMGLDSHEVDTIKYTLASQHPYYSSFPGTNFVYNDNLQPFDMFGKLSQQKAEFTGVHLNSNGMVFNLIMNDNSTQMTFPSQLGTTFTDHGSVSKDTLTTVPGFPFPVTVTIKVDFDVTSTIDANGLIITPLGSFKCLREYKEQITKVQVLAFGNPLPGYGGSDTLRTYNFINKEKGYPLVIVDVDRNANIIKIKQQK